MDDAPGDYLQSWYILADLCLYSSSFRGLELELVPSAIRPSPGIPASTQVA